MKTWVLLALVGLAFALCQVSADKKTVLCFISNLPVHNLKPLSPDKINVRYCSHLAYAFATIRDGKIAPTEDTTGTPEKTRYIQFNSLKKTKPDLQTIIAVGGPNTTTSYEEFGAMLGYSEYRITFTKSVIRFLRNYRFDGLLLDWQYPAVQDKKAYSLLVKELSKQFAEEYKRVNGTVKSRLYAAIALGNNKYVDIDAYDLSAFNEYLEFMVLEAFDFSGPWAHSTEPFSALYLSYKVPRSVNAFLETVVARGALPNKILLGIASYGRSFTLEDEKYTAIGANIIGMGKGGAYSQLPGFVTHYDVCKALANGFTRVFEPETKAPYAFKGDQWITYDDENSIRYKMVWLKEKGLGGASVWNLNTDDFDGKHCGKAAYPITRVVGRCLLEGSWCNPTVGDPRENKVLMCSFSNLSQFRKSKRFYPEYIEPSLCTHVLYMSARLDGNRVMPSVWNDKIPNRIGQGLYSRVNNLKIKNRAMKTLLGIGSGPESANNFSKMASTPENRRMFILSVISYLYENKFDGITLVWQYPNATDKSNFAALLKEMSAKFRDPSTTASSRLILTAEVSPKYSIINEGYNVPELDKYLDYFLLTAFDLHGHWDGKTGHNAGLYSSKTDKTSLSVADTAENWVKKGANKTKIVIVIPFYARTFKLKNVNQFDVGAPTVGPGMSGMVTTTPGAMAFFEAINEIVLNRYTLGWDEKANASYAFKSDQWFSIEEMRSLPYKVTWVVQKGFAGVVVRPLDFDDVDGTTALAFGKYPLMHAVMRCLWYVCNPSDEYRVGMSSGDDHSFYICSLTQSFISVALTLILLGG